MEEDLVYPPKDQHAKKNDIHSIIALNKHIFIAVAVLFLIVLAPSLFINERKEILKLHISPTPVAPTGKVTKKVTPPKTSNTPLPTPTVRVVTLNRTSYPIAIPFIREGSLYMYKNGKEEPIDVAAKKAGNLCFRFVDPRPSADGRYIAYMQETGERSDYGNYCTSHFLYIYEVSTGNKFKIPYNGTIIGWNNKNQLNIVSYSYTYKSDGESVDTQESSVNYIVYDPSDKETIDSSEVNVIDNDNAFRGFVISSDGKAVLYENKNYYLRDQQNNKVFLFSGEKISAFRGWSPNGRYAIFDTTETANTPNGPFVLLWNVVDTGVTPPKVSQITVLQGAAGGEPSVGTQWFFEKAFVSYCSSYLTYINGDNPLELATDGGGGCHNEDGFISTSPDENSAVVKLPDHFDLYTKEGTVNKIKEAVEIYKGRLSPARIQWITNDYAVIYESVQNYSEDTTEKPLIFLFEKATMNITPVVENGYLETYDYSAM